MKLARAWKVLVWLVVCLLLVMDGVFVYDLMSNHVSSDQPSSDASTTTFSVSTKATPNDASKKQASPAPVAAARVFIKVKLFSGKEKASILIGDREAIPLAEDRGMYIVVVNQATGRVMANRWFDTYMPEEWELLDAFLTSIMDGRYLFFAIMDEATFHLDKEARHTIKQLGSNLIDSLNWRDTWVFATQKQGIVLGEDVGKSPSLDTWGPDTTLIVRFPLEQSTVSCDWPESEENTRRRKFCARYEGYEQLCDCANPLPIIIKSDPLPDNNIRRIPVVIIASNRPQYLFKSLHYLLQAPGANASMVTVFIDGFFAEPVAVATLFGVNVEQHQPSSQRNGRITQHYGYSLRQIFSIYSTAMHAIILEEDLQVSPDFFSYFSQTLPLLDKDNSLYCISAWNDLGYEHSCEDSQLLYRVETMPGLGWLLQRQLFVKELDKQWPTPDKLWDWDMWMRMDGIRKGRECIIPDVSRTYHFGHSGTNVNPYFQSAYFKLHQLNKQPNVKLKDLNRMTQDEYENVLHELIRSASRNLHGDPCSKDFVPDTKGKVYTMFISKSSQKDYDTWMGVARCFKLWDLDARGFHKSLWRFWIKSNQIVVIGCPDSPYCTYKPEDLQPIKIEKKAR